MHTISRYSVEVYDSSSSYFDWYTYEYEELITQYVEPSKLHTADGSDVDYLLAVF